MALIIDGKKISQDIKNELKDKVEQLHAKGVAPCLGVIQVGNDPASSVYVRNKSAAARRSALRQSHLSCRKAPPRRSFSPSLTV